VFEVRLLNASDEPQRGTLAFSFVGPRASEVGAGARFERSSVSGDFSGIVVSTSRGNKEYAYALGVADGLPVRAGAEVLGVVGRHRYRPETQVSPDEWGARQDVGGDRR
jgi:hypothetical protein